MMCNVIVLNYRTGGILSTFVHAAARVSGDLQKTDMHGPIGRGMGTKAYKAVISKGNAHPVEWHYFWNY